MEPPFNTTRLKDWIMWAYYIDGECENQNVILFCSCFYAKCCHAVKKSAVSSLMWSCVPMKQTIPCMLKKQRRQTELVLPSINLGWRCSLFSVTGDT